MSAARKPSMTNIRVVPQEKATRDAIRELATKFAACWGSNDQPTRAELESAGCDILKELLLPHEFLGYAMVCFSNVFWQPAFESVPFNRRLLLLPRCLSNSKECTAVIDAEELHCANCGACDISGLKSKAEGLGYEVVTSEGTTSVITKILQGDADAILGVACLESLERSYSRVVDLGVPHVAVPLLHDGCVDTTTELDQLLAVLGTASEHLVPARRTYLPLLRQTAHIFDSKSLIDLLPEDIGGLLLDDSTPNPTTATEIIALEWLRNRGKRLRPFLTTSSYAVARYGFEALSADADSSALIPASVRRLALAIEALHKASLIHDDIEDDDEYRYGRKTLHRQYGIAAAINIGDYLVGLGYNLIAGGTEDLGAGCVPDVLKRLSAAHLELCRGQGAELFWKDNQDVPLRPIDALSIYAWKTAPALEVALYAGLRAAQADVDEALLHQFCVYLGEGYQVMNDLDDWQPYAAGRVRAGGDAIANRPTILHAFALDAGGEAARNAINSIKLTGADVDEEVNRLRQLYTELAVFDQAQRLVERLRGRAESLIDSFNPRPLGDLMRFLVTLILPNEYNT